MSHKAIALIAASFVIGTISTTALAATGRTAATADRDVRILVQMMDKDKNGVVSREEFMQFMGETFDHLDADKSGALEPRELRPLRDPLSLCYKRGFPQCRGRGL